MPQDKKKTSADIFFLRIHPLHKVFIGLIFSLITFFILQGEHLNWKIEGLIIWIAFASAYLILSWFVFLNCSAQEVRGHAGKEDGSRLFVSLLIMISSLFGIVTVLLLIISGKGTGTSEAVFLIVVITSMFLSWIMVHTTYSFHYAHLFYDRDKKDPKVNAGGLDFPGSEAPDYLDFAYFAFVIGMTFQVSDVGVTSRRIRRQALMHGLLSFALNTIVVALTINLIAGLMK